jgi:hypothetical protein
MISIIIVMTGASVPTDGSASSNPSPGFSPNKSDTPPEQPSQESSLSLEYEGEESSQRSSRHVHESYSIPSEGQYQHRQSHVHGGDESGDGCDGSGDGGDDQFVPIDLPDSDGDMDFSCDEDELQYEGDENGFSAFLDCVDGIFAAPLGSSLAPPRNDSSPLPDDWRTYIPTKKQATHRDAFEVIKATLCLSDEEMSKALRIWKNMKPVEDWKNFVVDARLLARASLRHLRGVAPRRVVCGLKKPDLVPFFKPTNPRKKTREEMLKTFLETGTTIAKEDIKVWGDCIDFDIEKILLMQSPGNLNPREYLRFLKKVHAARPNLLSLDFVRLVDQELYYHELYVEANPLRSKMNFFNLKWHTDGIQIAKNSTSAEGKPISFMIDMVCPYDPETKEVTTDTSIALRIPPSQTSVMTVTVYHGRGKADLFQFMDFWKKEEWRLSVDNEDPDVLKNRRMVIGYLLTIADAPERSLNLGTYHFEVSSKSTSSHNASDSKGIHAIIR